MQIDTYSNKVLTKEVTKSYTDFQTADTSNSITLTSFTDDQVIIGLNVEVTDGFGGIQNTENLLTVGDGFTNLIKKHTFLTNRSTWF